MRKFDFYEFAGIITPGTITLVGVVAVFPGLQGLLLNKELTVGDFALVLILAYAAGHMVQAVGNLLEWCWWNVQGGMPSQWVRSDKGNLLAVPQRNALPNRMSERFNMDDIGKYENLSPEAWYALTRQAYAAVAKAGQSARIDRFNGNYGLNRGLAASLMLIAVVVLAANYHHWKYAAILTALAIVACARMHRFGKHYARELFVQFLEMTTHGEGGAKNE